MSGQEPPQWEEGREAGKSLDGKKQQTRMFTLPLLDLGLKPRGSDPKEVRRGASACSDVLTMVEAAQRP